MDNNYQGYKSCLGHQVDNVKTSASFNTSIPADRPAFVVVGGVKTGNFRHHLDGFANFTGHIASKSLLYFFF